jgi:hypothetical protein
MQFNGVATEDVLLFLENRSDPFDRVRRDGHSDAPAGELYSTGQAPEDNGRTASRTLLSMFTTIRKSKTRRLEQMTWFLKQKRLCSAKTGTFREVIAFIEAVRWRGFTGSHKENGSIIRAGAARLLIQSQVSLSG